MARFGKLRLRIYTYVAPLARENVSKLSLFVSDVCVLYAVGEFATAFLKSDTYVIFVVRCRTTHGTTTIIVVYFSPAGVLLMVGSHTYVDPIDGRKVGSIPVSTWYYFERGGKRTKSGV